MTFEQAIMLLNRPRERPYSLVARIPSTTESRNAWIKVYPIELASPLGQDHVRKHRLTIPAGAPRMYAVYRVEVNESACRDDTRLGPSDIYPIEQHFEFDVATLKARLETYGIHDSLCHPADVDYPL